MGPKDWSPLLRKPTTKDGQELERWLEGVVILGGEGQIDLGSVGPVYIAVVHDGGGYNPGAAIAVDQNPYHDLSGDVLETAYEIMTEDAMKDKEYVKELDREFGDRSGEVLTESFDGKTWTFKSPHEAALAIRGDKRTMKFITINPPERK